MEISVIASGSNGNCCLVEEKGASILIDAGKSCREIDKRLNSVGKSLENVNAILITHSHHDHLCGAGVISRKFEIPVYLTQDTYAETSLYGLNVKHFQLNKRFKINGMDILPVKTSHNVASCGFVVKNFGLFTDTGIVTNEMEAVLPKLKGILLESNHDIDMVINGHYPPFLKQWILSDKGHLSNVHASSFLKEKGDNLSLVLLGHLSGNNNTPELAKAAFETLVKRKIDYSVCSRDNVSGKWEI